MDKETLSNYGWIVICTLVLAVMIALATPFGEYIKDGVWSATNGLNDALNKNMEIVGLGGVSGNTSNFNGLRYNEKYICIEDFENGNDCLDYYMIFYENNSAYEGYASDDSWYYEYPAGTLIYNDATIFYEEDEGLKMNIVENGAKIEVLYEDEPYFTFIHESLIDWTDESIDVDGYATFTDGTTLTWTELKAEGYNITNNVIYASAFENCTTLKTIKIPDTVKAIGSSAFYYCSSLASITVPNSVKYMGSYAFSNCENLTSMTFPNNITRISSGIFYYCSSLTNVTIPNSVTSMGYEAFYGCSSLKTIAIPSSITYIDESAFGFCNSLESVYITDLTAWCNIEFEKQASNPLYSATNLYLNGNLIKNLVLPNDVTVMRDFTFEKGSFESVTIPGNVENVRDISQCASLTNITILDGVKMLDAYAFKDNPILTNVTIPASVTTIKNYVFMYCPLLTSINYEGTMAQWNAISKEVNSWNYNSSVKSVICSDGTITV